MQYREAFNTYMEQVRQLGGATSKEKLQAAQEVFKTNESNGTRIYWSEQPFALSLLQEYIFGNQEPTQEYRELYTRFQTSAYTDAQIARLLGNTDEETEEVAGKVVATIVPGNTSKSSETNTPTEAQTA